MSNPPNITGFWRTYPHKVLLTFGRETGRQGPVANSRLAHMEISAGRQILEDLEIIDRSITDNSFYHNRVLADCFKYARDHNSNIHLVGLISDAGVNSKVDHLLALLEMAHRQNFTRVFVDAIIDGIDSQVSALKFVEALKKKFHEIGFGQFSSVVGRQKIMSVASNQDDLIRLSELLFSGKGAQAETIEEAITKNYSSGKKDEDLEPTLVKISDTYQTIKTDDVVIVFNLKGGNSRGLIKVLTGRLRRLFWTPNLPSGILLATLTKYAKNLTNPIIFPREPVADGARPRPMTGGLGYAWPPLRTSTAIPIDVSSLSALDRRPR